MRWRSRRRVTFAIFTALALGLGCAVFAADVSAGVDAAVARAGRLDGSAEAGDGGADLRHGDLAGLGVGAVRWCDALLARCWLDFCCWRLRDGLLGRWPAKGFASAIAAVVGASGGGFVDLCCAEMMSCCAGDGYK